ncbi:hypothetical protein [Flectobacillus longus]|uniref:hypothetical protein n=1 Tax=Flectobacillus longus TaxID=2984207 RepID=UPI0024B64F15|nr:hypothetical protein [Flectobacillus longus]MDI9880831.1 hypothetical protein [Flectobacillus longus]
MAIQYNYRALFLFIILTFRMLSFLLVYLDYNLRKDYIAKNLCQNRNRPSMHCNGKCYLSKQLAKAAEQKEAQQKYASQSVDLYCSTMPQITASMFNTYFYIVSKYFFIGNGYLQNFYSKVFKPPTFSSVH